MSNEKSVSNRYYMFDNLKFLLIILVVIGHFADILCDNLYGDYTGDPSLPISDLFNKIYLFIYAFHMPLFMFLSGLFFKDGEKLNTSKVLKYFVLGMLLKMLLYLSMVVFRTDFKKDIPIDFSLTGGDGAYWYLIALAAFAVIVHAVRNVSPWLVMSFAVLLNFFCGYDNSVGDNFTLSRIIVFFPFFYVGFLVDPQKLADVFTKLYMRILGVVLIAVWAYFSFARLELTYPLRGIFTGRNSFDSVSKTTGIAIGWEHRLLVMSISFILCGAVLALGINRKIPFITKAGSRTLQVYFWHRTVLYALVYFEYPQKLARYFPNNYRVYYILTAVVLTFVLSLKPFGVPLDCIMKQIGNNKGAGKNDK